MSRLEAEIARELGQPVSLEAGGEIPDEGNALYDLLELPGALLTVAANREDLAAFLVEGHLVEAGKGDAETIRELWAEILASVAARLEGRVTTRQPANQLLMRPCILRLGQAAMRMGLSLELASEDTGNAPGGANYDLLLEVEMSATVRFGSREIELGELLELGPGDVVELDRQVSDPVDLIVGDKIVARGEVVLINGNFGLRVTEVAEPTRRLESIRCLF